MPSEPRTYSCDRVPSSSIAVKPQCIIDTPASVSCTISLAVHRLLCSPPSRRTTLSFCTLFVAVGVALLAVGLRKSTSAGFLGVTLSQLVGFSQGLQNLILAWTRVENGVVSVERVREIVNAPSEPKRSVGLDVDVPPEWPSRGKIEFRNVTLRYREDLDPALKNLSFVINGGEKMGICGRTGFARASFASPTTNSVLQEWEKQHRVGAPCWRGSHAR